MHVFPFFDRPGKAIFNKQSFPLAQVSSSRTTNSSLQGTNKENEHDEVAAWKSAASRVPGARGEHAAMNVRPGEKLTRAKKKVKALAKLRDASPMRHRRSPTTSTRYKHNTDASPTHNIVKHAHQCGAIASPVH